jgi:DNA modification methylase
MDDNKHEKLIHVGHCLEVMRGMQENSVDAIVTDPPYGQSFMGNGWDYDVPGTEIWAECRRVLKPGGHLLAFAGTRTQHRMAVVTRCPQVLLDPWLHAALLAGMAMLGGSQASVNCGQRVASHVMVDS